MIVSEVRNVCQALPKIMEILGQHGRKESSRAGDVLVAPCPVVTEYERPRERVLFAAVRDANPWFHVMEAMWMLTGQDHTKPLQRYVKNFGERFAEPNGTMHGAYGHRWRIAFGFDQLEFVVEKLRQDPQTRQCVIQMWDSYPLGSDDLCGNWKDRPCNTHVYLRIFEHRLDMTICCRSNDMILGGYGANAVHFSILQEYLAAKLGIGVGRLYQLSNNCHVYLSEIEKMSKRLQKGTSLIYSLQDDRYSRNMVMSLPMFDDPETANDDLARIFEQPSSHKYHNSWFRHTLQPMIRAHDLYSRGDKKEAHAHCHDITSPDWQQACAEWVERRL